MKIGITGASGFLGGEILSQAKAKGWTVIAFSRSATAIPGADEVRSLADREQIDLNDLDAVIHLAGEPIVGLWTKEKKRRIHESRVDLTQDIVDALEKITRSRRPEVLVSASAIGFYGDRDDEWLDEESDVGFGFLSEVCRDWERTAEGAKRLGVRVVNPRIGIVLGEEGFLRRLRPIFRLGLGGHLGSGKQWMSWIHVEDLAGIFLKCVAESTIHGRVNCVTPEPVQNREFTKIYARILRRPAWFPVPRFLLNRLPGGMSELFLASQRVDPVVARAFQFEYRHASLESALEAVEEDRS
jgi:uncharacterized protein (TIGR01777 family)